MSVNSVHGEVKTYYLSPEELEKYRAMKPSKDDLAIKKQMVLQTPKEAAASRRRLKKKRTG